MKFDCNAFLRRKNWKQRDLANILGVSTSLVGGWCTGKSFPLFPMLFKLIDAGITLQELFGEEYAEKLSSPARNKEEVKKDVKKALSEILSELSKN